ncbi:hypothetical protein CHELA40_11279 [Chelatococcus asaccharovorans]|nr:hypothetical protein CHELA40_11279 [Chelatococcus asaccharovorans]CAH1685085.1 hypothetical protein CHELA17_64323 [Chelatococcus asaccharovorans]
MVPFLAPFHGSPSRPAKPAAGDDKSASVVSQLNVDWSWNRGYDEIVEAKS